jgi:ketosteroid isomerase-like protein
MQRLKYGMRKKAQASCSSHAYGGAVPTMEHIAMKPQWAGAALAAVMLFAPVIASATPESDRRAVAALDTEYQAAVKRNDAEAMARILHEDFVLVLGDGKTYTRDDLLGDARNKSIVYERQDEDAGTRTVRVWGDTAVVTARLWLKGTRTGPGPDFEYRLWFSDTYVRTPEGWRYVFGQASLALPQAQAMRTEPVTRR